MLMTGIGKSNLPPPKIPGFPDNWRDQIKADLAAQLEAGGTPFGIRSDGAYITDQGRGPADQSPRSEIRLTQQTSVGARILRAMSFPATTGAENRRLPACAGSAGLK